MNGGSGEVVDGSVSISVGATSGSNAGGSVSVISGSGI